jgi:hypothetical protein
MLAALAGPPFNPPSRPSMTAAGFFLVAVLFCLRLVAMPENIRERSRKIKANVID